MRAKKDLPPMSVAERKLAAQVLEMASDEFSRHGCNDFKREYTKLTQAEWDEVMVTMTQWLRNGAGEEDAEACRRGYTYDWMVMSFLAHRIGGDPAP